VTAPITSNEPTTTRLHHYAGRYSSPEDDRLVLEAFFLGDGTQDDAVQQICNHFYVERTTAYQEKSRALARLATALYGRL